MWLKVLPRSLALRCVMIVFFCLLIPVASGGLRAQVKPGDKCPDIDNNIVNLQVKLELLADLADYLDDATTPAERQAAMAEFIRDVDQETPERRRERDEADQEFLDAALGKISPEMRPLEYRQMLAEELKLDWNPVWNTDLVKFLRAVNLRRQLIYLYWKENIKSIPQMLSPRTDIRRGTIPWFEDSLRKAKESFARNNCAETLMRGYASSDPPISNGTTTSTTTFDANASNNDLAAGYPTRGFGDSNQVDVWIPFQVDTGRLSNVTSATFTIRLKPIGQLIGTDAMALKGADGKTYWYKIEFKTENPEWQDFVIDVTDTEVLKAIMNGRLLGVVEDDSAVQSVKVKVTFKK